MKIIYSDSKNIEIKQLQQLFLAVNWESGEYPAKLTNAILQHSIVYTAWDKEEDKLIGLISSIDDGALNAHIIYFLVNPSYQKRGIGSQLLKFIKEKYNEYLNFSVISYKATVPYYERFNFKKDTDAFALFYDSKS